MTLVCRLEIDYESPDVHAHYSRFVEGLERDDPLEWLRTLAVVSDSLRTYARQLDDFRAARERDGLEA